METYPPFYSANTQPVIHPCPLQLFLLSLREDGDEFDPRELFASDSDYDAEYAEDTTLSALCLDSKINDPLVINTPTKPKLARMRKTPAGRGKENARPLARIYSAQSSKSWLSPSLLKYTKRYASKTVFSFLFSSLNGCLSILHSLTGLINPRLLSFHFFLSSCLFSHLMI